MSGRVRLSLVWLGCALELSAAARGGDDPALRRPVGSPPPITGPVLFAFNGKDLAGFSTFLRFQKKADPRHVFAVVDGCLRISGQEFGGITTAQSFANYHLVAEWRWGGATWSPRRWGARNSGILLHCTGNEGDGFGSWMPGLESQLIEGGSGDLILVPDTTKTLPTLQLRASVRTGADGQAYYDPGGSVVTRTKGRLNWWGRAPNWHDVTWYRGPIDLDHPVGAWNRTEIVCAGDRVTSYLNGQVANAAEVVGPAAGRVLLQSEGAEILFRKFVIYAGSAQPN